MKSELTVVITVDANISTGIAKVVQSMQKYLNTNLKNICVNSAETHFKTFDQTDYRVAKYLYFFDLLLFHQGN